MLCAKFGLILTLQFWEGILNIVNAFLLFFYLSPHGKGCGPSIEQT